MSFPSFFHKQPRVRGAALMFLLSLVACVWAGNIQQMQKTSAPNSSITPSAPNSSITPSAPNSSITPSAPNSSIQPSASNNSITPSAPNSSIQPSAPNSSIQPSAPNSSITPSAPNSSIQPSASNSSITPSAPNSGITPSAHSSSIQPSAPNSRITTSAPNIRITPSAPNSSIQPSASNSSITPSAPNSGITPSATDSSITPSAHSSSIQPSVTNSSITPSALNNSIQPSTPNSSIQPSTPNSSIQPSAPNSGKTPSAPEINITLLATNSSITPPAVDCGITPPAADTGITPSAPEINITLLATNSSITPPAADTGITPSAPEINITLLATNSSITPPAADSGITPSATESSITSSAANSSTAVTANHSRKSLAANNSRTSFAATCRRTAISANSSRTSLAANTRPQKSRFEENKSQIINTTETNAQNSSVQLPSCGADTSTRKVTIIENCPTDKQDRSLAEKCHNGSYELPPVSAIIGHENVTFKNVFCARCHGVTNTKLTAWSTQIICGEGDVADHGLRFTFSGVSALITDGRCQIAFISPGVKCKPTECDQNSAAYKHLTTVVSPAILQALCSEEDAPLCQTYFYPKNKCNNTMCLKCLNQNGRKSIPLVTDQVCDIDFTLIIKMISPTQVISTGGVLIMLDFTGTYSQEQQTSEFICQEVEVYDPLTRSCEALICPPWLKPYKGECVELSDVLFTEGSSQLFPAGWASLVVRLIPDSEPNQTCEVLFKRNDLVEDGEQNPATVSPYMLGQVQQAFQWSTSCPTLFKVNETEFETHVKHFLLLASLESHGYIVNVLMGLATRIPSLELAEGSYHVHVSNKVNLTAPWPRCPDNTTPYLTEQFTIVTNKSGDYALVNTSVHQIYFPVRNIGFEFSLKCCSDRPGNNTVSQLVALCGINWLSLNDNCSVVQYWLNETVPSDSGLMVLASQRHYNIGDFQVQGDAVLVCSDFEYATVQRDSRSSLPYIVLSWLLTTLSTIFLLVMLVLYWLLPELRTLPGKMTASLAATMMVTFLTNAFSLHHLHHDYVCPVVAALSHVFTLAHFGWMSAIAVNMASTFGPLTKALARTQKDRTVFRRYNVVVWGVSLVLVLTSVTLYLTHKDASITSESTTTVGLSSDFPRYGYPICTWFSGPLWAKLVFIIVPYFTTFIVSLVGFVLTLVGIQRASKNSKKLGKNASEKARCLIYIKLSSAMGFSWILSLVVSTYPEVEALSYIYTSLVLLQGVLLFLSFMVNHRVYSLLLKRFMIVSHTLSKSGSTHDISTIPR